jgi:hypothetical protein
VCWSIVVREKLIVDSPFFGAFPSYLNPKETKDSTAAILVNCKSEFREGFKASACNNLNTYIINVIYGL